MFGVPYRLGFLLLLACASCKCEVEDKPGYLNATDLEFLKSDPAVNNAVADMASLAATRAAVPAVRTINEDIAAEGSRAYVELEDIAAGLGHKLSGDLPGTHEALRQYLATQTGTSFDTAYLRISTNRIREHIVLLETELTDGYDPQLANYAQRQLIKARRHCELLDSVRKTF